MASALANDSPDPWAGGWRLNGPARLRLAAEGEERTVTITGRASPSESRSIGGIGPSFVVTDDGAVHVDVNGRSVAFRLAPPPDVDRTARAARPGHGSGPSSVVAPMPGSVVAVHVSVGASVSAGDPVATLAAMKMEHVIASPSAGTVSDVLVRAGQQVTRDQLLAIVEG